jgi:mandelate racemase
MKAVMKTEIHAPKVRELRVRAVRVPMEQPHQTASGTISESPLVLTDVIADDGTVGHSMIFTYTVAALKPTADLIENLEPLVKGEASAPTEIADRLASVERKIVAPDSERLRAICSM